MHVDNSVHVHYNDSIEVTQLSGTKPHIRFGEPYPCVTVWMSPERLAELRDKIDAFLKEEY